jgi:hypothetical protein
VQVAATTPQTARGLLAVCPDVAELLAVVALSKPVLSFVRLYLDCNVAEAGQSEELLGLRRSGQSDEEQGKVNNMCFFWRSPTGGCHLSDVNDVETQTHQTARNILSRSVLEKVTNYSLDWFFGFGEESEVGKVVDF